MSNAVGPAEPAKGCGPCTSPAFRAIVRVVAIATSIAVLVVSIFGLLGAGVSIRAVIACVYQIIFAIVLVLSELKFKVVVKWFRFTAPYHGLGAFYLFIAVFTIQQGRWWQILVAAFCAGIGALYCVFACAGMDRGLDLKAIDDYNERDEAAKYAAGKVADHYASKDAKAAANASLESDNHGVHHSAGNDNPFESSGRPGKSAYD